jgi:hypothetical protein
MPIPRTKGSEKLLKAIQYFRDAAIQAGFWIADEDAEKKVRVAYQALKAHLSGGNLKKLIAGAISTPAFRPAFEDLLRSLFPGNRH